MPVSTGRTVLKYHARSPEFLSFANNQHVIVFAKDAGVASNGDQLWEVEVCPLQMYIIKLSLIL